MFSNGFPADRSHVLPATPFRRFISGRVRVARSARTVSNGYWPATVNNQANQSARRSRLSRFYESMSELGDNRDETIIRTLFRVRLVPALHARLQRKRATHSWHARTCNMGHRDSFTDPITSIYVHIKR